MASSAPTVRSTRCSKTRCWTASGSHQGRSPVKMTSRSSPCSEDGASGCGADRRDAVVELRALGRRAHDRRRHPGQGHRGRDVTDLTDERVDHPLCVRIEDAPAALEDVPHDSRGVLRVGEPGRRPRHRGGGPNPVRNRGTTEEVLPEERRQRLTELLLAFDDDRGVWDRYAERVPEQRGDREPVGQRSDHRRLERRARRIRPSPPSVAQRAATTMRRRRRRGCRWPSAASRSAVGGGHLPFRGAEARPGWVPSRAWRVVTCPDSGRCALLPTTAQWKSRDFNRSVSPSGSATMRRARTLTTPWYFSSRPRISSAGALRATAR